MGFMLVAYCPFRLCFNACLVWSTSVWSVFLIRYRYSFGIIIPTHHLGLGTSRLEPSLGGRLEPAREICKRK
ncbi:hypothetical protein BGX38DRAFT_178249 [Terfezia claveryi]|nr:hypothetical protein BGX38DRAFT_178249 [Terfezia claveryi]